MSKDLKDYTKEELLEYIKTLKRAKKFGLVWEEKPEQVVKDVETKLPVLEEVSTRAITTDPDSPTHLIIEGDNYHSLSTLNYTHAGEIDVIYIDPPYNTGNKDFIYNDNYVDKEDSFRHSKWLSFMSRRLELAKTLLSDTGMLFISIDDNELSQLRLLCDSIFGEDNFINCISVKTKSSAGASGGGEDKKLKKNVEYLLFYAKSKPDFNYRTTYVETDLMDIIAEKRDDGKQFEYRKVLFNEGEKTHFATVKDGSGMDIKIYKHSSYEIKSVPQLIKEEGLTEEEVYFNYFDKVFRGQPAQSSIRTRVNEATGNNKDLFSIEYTPRSGRRKGQIAVNHYINCDLVNWLSDTAIKTKSGVKKREKLGTLWAGFSWNGLSSEGGVSFSNGKKPVSFIKKIIEHHPSNDVVVLDFFAGSGTTGHAVLDLNRADGGTRQFILGTNNEAGIAENVTYERIKNVIKGYGRTEGIPANVRYLKTNFVDKQKTNDQTRLAIVDRSADLIRVRDNAFEAVIDEADLKVFKGAEHLTAIVFDPDKLVEHVNRIEELGLSKIVNLYVFSLSNYAYQDELPDTELEITACPIPESILEVYQRIFRKRVNNV